MILVSYMSTRHDSSRKTYVLDFICDYNYIELSLLQLISRWQSLWLRSTFNTSYQLKRCVSHWSIFWWKILKGHSQCLLASSYLCSEFRCLLFLFFSFLVSQRKDDFESVVMEHLRMNGVYWGLTTLDLLGKLKAVDLNEVVSWVMSCQHESGILKPHFSFLLSWFKIKLYYILFT